MANPFTPEEISQILQAFFDTVGTRQYIGARYVPIFGRKGEDSIQWDNSAPYEPLTVVLYQGDSYTSRQYVPAGVEITNNSFWAQTGNFNGQIATLQNSLERFETEITDEFDSFKSEVNTNFEESMTGFTNSFNELESQTQADISDMEESLNNAIEIVNARFVDNFYTKFKRDNGTKLYSIAHRGFRNSFVPENTIEAFEYACKCAPDLVETDIYFTSDEQIVCMHDNAVGNYVSQLEGAPSEYTLAQIQQYPIDVGSGVLAFPNCKIPTLQEVLETVSKYGVPLAIELKETNLNTARINAIIKAVNDFNYANMVVYTGSYNNCALLKSLNLTALCNVNISSVSETVIANLKRYGFAAQLDVNGATQSNIDMLINAGIAFNVWFRGDVSNTAQYSSLMGMGCYAMFFDDIRQANASTSGDIHTYIANTEKRGDYLQTMQKENNILFACNCSSGELIPTYNRICGIPNSIQKDDLSYNTFASLVLFESKVPRNGINLCERNSENVWNNRNLPSKTYVENGRSILHWHNATEEIVGFFTEQIEDADSYIPYDFSTRIFKSNVFFASIGSVGSQLVNGNNVFTAPELMVPVGNTVNFSFEQVDINDTFELVYGVYFYDATFKRVAGISIPYNNVNEGINIVGPYPNVSDAFFYMIGFRIRNRGTGNVTNFTSSLDDDTYKKLVPIFKSASFARFTEII